MKNQISHFYIKALISFLFFAIHTLTFAQRKQEASNVGWHLKDLTSDGVFGISMEKAYKELLSKKKPASVIVSVLDGGVDIAHEDLNKVIWTNEKEIAGNGIDDDGNGFVDDLHGWNFYNTMKAGDEEFDIRDLVMRIRKNEKGKDSLQHVLDLRLSPLKEKLKRVLDDRTELEKILRVMNKTKPSLDDFKNFIPETERQLRLLKEMVAGIKVFPDFVSYKLLQLKRTADYYKMQLSYYEKQDYNLLTGGPTAYHGTHISGIIAAIRNNGIGINGVADQVKIMVVRMVGGVKPIDALQNDEPEMLRPQNKEDERYQNFAKAIRYAVNNGAKVINISIGDPWTLTSVLIEEAVKEAIAKDVLIIHAAGNQGLDLDKKSIFPDRNTKEGKIASEYWIEVAASGLKNEASLAGPFSNYGKSSVDVYAPGVDIYSTIPRSGYLADTGTSMAAPVVTGLAASLRAYYPGLTAPQIKEILLKSVVKSDFLKDKCISGGVINAYQAFKMAAGF